LPEFQICYTGERGQKAFAGNVPAIYPFRMGSELPDHSLVSGYLKGEGRAHQAVEGHIEAAFGVWRHRVGYEADDILSDIHYKLLLSLRRGDFQYRSSLKTFINRIVNHTCVDYVRFNRRFASSPVEDLPLVDESPGPDEEFDRREQLKLLLKVMRQVPKECLRLFYLHYRKRTGYKEIGEQMGISEGNARRRTWACREAARRLWEKWQKKSERS